MNFHNADPKMYVFSDNSSLGFRYENDSQKVKFWIIRSLYSLLAENGELDYEANLAIAVLNGDRVAARALADKIIEEVTL